MPTYRELYTNTKNKFEDANIKEPDIDARLLLMHVTRMSAAQLFLRMEDDAPADIASKYLSLSQKRCTRYPLQYIIGEQGFYGFDFNVAEGVLIPRADTEILVDEALRVLSDKSSVMDICTGTGIILITLAKMKSLEGCVGVDTSLQALSLAKENADRLGVSPMIQWIRSDLYSDVPEGLNFDLITANPPYIDTKVLDGLQPEVKDFEPRLALDGGEGGLDFYRPIAEGAMRHLKPGGWLVTEIGYDQGKAVRDIFDEAGLTNIEVIKDLASDDRVVKGQKIVR